MNHNQSKHPSEDILTVWLYENEIDSEFESDWSSEGIQSHVDACDRCRQFLQNQKSVGRAMDQLEVPESTRSVDVSAIFHQSKSSEREVETDKIVSLSNDSMSSISLRSRLLTVGLAAAVLVMMGVSFFLGMSYQAEATKVALQQQIDQNFQRLQAKLDSQSGASNDVWKKDEFKKWLDKRVNEIRSTNQSKSDLLVRNKLNEIAEQIHSLLANQSAMKSDILTIAVNADKEIKIAKNDIHQIKQYVSQFLTSRP